MPGWLDTLHDFGDILATELGVREHLYRLKSDGLYRIVSDDRDVRVGGDLKQQVPSTVQTVPPVYPPRAKASGVEGQVCLEVIIGRDGLVEAAAVCRSVPELDAAAVEAVEQWQYHPVLLNSRPIRLLTEVKVRFALNRHPGRPRWSHHGHDDGE